jgi:RHS repeat-associated protein
VSTSYTGNQTTVTDEAGNQRTSTNDGLGRLTVVLEAPNYSSYNYQTLYTYDALNDLLSVNQTGSSRTRTFTYDSLSRLLCAANPEVQVVTCPTSGTTFPAGAITYSYDLNSNLSSKIAPQPGQTTGEAIVTTNYSYDALNRLAKKAYVGLSTPQAQFGYDGTALTGCSENPPTITSPTNLNGRRSAMCSGSSSSSWSYDPMGRPLEESRLNKGSVQKTLNAIYSYNLDGSLKTLTYPSGDLVTYTPGGAGRPLGVSDSSNDYVAITGGTALSATYAPHGALATMTNDYTSSTSIATSNLYNDRLQPLKLSAVFNTTLSLFSLCYDFHLGVAISTSQCPNVAAYNPPSDNGNVGTMANGLDGTRSVNYVYDPLNRIAQAYTVNATSGNCWGETYSPTATAPGVLPTPGIDAWGNLTNRTGVTGMNGCATESALNLAKATNQNHLPGISYDIAGNVLNDGNGNTPTYDAENRIVTDAGVTYSYDANGVRIEKSSGTMYWPGPSGTLAETNLSGTINEEYIYFNGERIARVDRPGGAPHYYFSNHLGSHTMVVSATGVCEQDIDYYPYGGVVTDHCPIVAQHYKFTGKERDPESGLDMFGARYYGSSMGRFMTPDWSSVATAVPYADFGNPQSLNLYSYTKNNPTTLRDPNGHCDVDGEHHGWVWCAAHAIGITETQKEQAAQARANLSGMRGLLINGRPASLWAKTATNQQLIGAQSQLVHSLALNDWTDLFKGSSGIQQAAGMLTQWGWAGQQGYNEAKNLLNEPNTSQGTVDRRDLLGKVPSEEEAVKMIEDAGGKVERIEEGHAPGGVSPHENPHINYTTSSGAKGTIDIQR